MILKTIGSYRWFFISFVSLTNEVFCNKLVLIIKRLIMRLYLSSFHLGKQPEIFAELVGDNKKIAMILDAGDAMPQEMRLDRVSRQAEELKAIGLDGVDVDLRSYFNREEDLRKEMSQYGGVWVPGGSAFVLRQAMRESGFDNIITDMLKEDKIAYGGYSAGICVLAPNLKGMELADPVEEAKQVFNKEIIWSGLNLIPYMPVPHYESTRPEYAVMTEVQKLLEKEGIPYKTLHDGEVIVSNGKNQELISEANLNWRKELGLMKK